jgi:hypothetical protein
MSIGHKLPLTALLLLSWTAGYAADETPKTPTDVEVLREQIALQQKQLEAMRAALEAQQKALEAQQKKIEKIDAPVAETAQASAPLPGLTREAAAVNPELASLSAPGTLRIPSLAAQAAVQLPNITVAQVPAPVPVTATPVAQVPRIVSASQEHEHATVRQPKHWYEKYSFKGYTQLRHNRILQTNDNLICDQCDSSTGTNNNFIFRRVRLVITGDITDKVFMYIQPDFAVTNGDRHFGQLRDAYFDIALDQKKEFRFRVGQSKVPFSFENMQSSQNRIPLDRNDATNSSFANERDLGVFFYWAPTHIRALFSELTSKGLKGSGDYGVLGIGMYNGQILNRAELNNRLHYSYRWTYPFKLRNGQIIETSVQAYHGRFTVASRTTGVRGTPGFLYDDRRVAATFVLFPQPFGLQAEYNYGTGPEYNTATRTIDQNPLSGGYALATYMKRFKNGMILTPFYRFTNYSGGKKQELDARHYIVRDHEMGVEYQANAFVELTLQYAKGFRIFEDAARPNWQQSGHQFRVQLQLNY